ncbi:prepilin peptidase [Brevibacillus sp. NPDC003359]|uniref:prepilin peptidase n=1 Tax=unclassified Brevibacillus TaxID=2684853 RepID=UPI003698AA2E
MNIVGVITSCLLLLMYIIAIYTDVKFRKIKNWLTLPLILLGFIGSVYQNGLWSTVVFTIALVVLSIICMMIPIWAAGDTKLYIAGGLLTSIIVQSNSIISATGILLIIVILHLGIGHFIWLKRLNFNIFSYIREITHSILVRQSKDQKEKEVIAILPGAIAIAVGNLAYIGAILINL